MLNGDRISRSHKLTEEIPELDPFLVFKILLSEIIKVEPIAVPITKLTIVSAMKIK